MKSIFEEMGGTYQREGMTEALKASAQLEWTGRMNNIRNCAQEIVLTEVVYK